MAYNRADAISYADKHWNVPADDGLFWRTDQAVHIDQVRARDILGNPGWAPAPAEDGWMPYFTADDEGAEQAVFQREVGGQTEQILIQPWAGIADCAHFLTRCLSAGGLKIAEISVPTLVHHLQSLPNTKTLCEFVDTETGQRMVDSGLFKPGDMIGYFNVDPNGDYNGARQYAHSGMYVGRINGSVDGSITCHTICRFPGRSWVEDQWWLHPPNTYIYTMIHIADDDVAPDAAEVSKLAGWWKVEAEGETDYYLVSSSGTARLSRSAPHAGQTSVAAPDGTAYWFMDNESGVVTFAWRQTGNVEVWTPSGGEYSSLVNGDVVAALTKV